MREIMLAVVVTAIIAAGAVLTFGAVLLDALEQVTGVI